MAVFANSRAMKRRSFGGPQDDTKGACNSVEKLRKPRKFSSIVVQAFSQTGLGKRGSPIGEQLQPILGVSPAKALRRKGFKK